MKVNAMTKSNPNSLTEAFDTAYDSTKRNDNLASYVGMLEGMLIVRLEDHPGSRERIIRDLKNFAGTGW